MNKSIAIVGGGAAGMMAAVQAAYAGAHVTVYERNDRVGKKILSTGNGKCNFSNEFMNAGCYYGSGVDYIEKVYDNFGVEDTKEFFRNLGMRIRSRNGYLYPASEQAATVLDILRYEMERLGIQVYTGCKVTEVRSQGESQRKPFAVEAEGHKTESYDAVVLACGGKAAQKTGSDGSGFVLAKRLGHKIIPVVPALTALRCKESFFKQVAGVRCEACLTLYIEDAPACTVDGELQLTDYGISGIPVFQFSRTAAYALREHKNVMVEIDFVPNHSDGGFGCVNQYDDLASWFRDVNLYGNSGMCFRDVNRRRSSDPGFRDANQCGNSDPCFRDANRCGNSDPCFWEARWERQENQKMEQFVTGIVNKKIGLLLLKLSGISERERACDVVLSKRKKLETLCHSLRVTVTETNSFEQAQVCAGGVDFREISEQLMSLKVPGLFFAGEMLDVDGICGGYNLQWAWSSGAVAGRAAAGM